MLEPIDLLPGARESLRRSVRIACDLVSETFDEPVELEITDLSADGAFVSTSLPLADGEEIELAFEIPQVSRLLAVRAKVSRAALHRRSQDARASGMGIEFVGLSETARRYLDQALVGIPPRLPVARASTPPKRMRKKPSRGRRAMLWVDALHDWGDQEPSAREIEDALDAATPLTTLHLG